MKKILLAFGLLSTSFLWAQSKSCCSVNTVSAKNAEMAMNETFAAEHKNPVAYVLEMPKGEMVTFATPDGQTAKGYFLKTAKNSKKYLYVFHEWWGLNDYIKKEAEHYFGDLKEVNVLAIDLFNGNVADTREAAQKYTSSMNDARCRAVINGAFAFAGKGTKVATLGWCLGGTWSLQAAIEGGSKVDGCVMYYGFPEMDLEKLKKLDCSILGIFGEKDVAIHVDSVKAFEDRVKLAGKEIVVYNYVAGHAFATRATPTIINRQPKMPIKTRYCPT